MSEWIDFAVYVTLIVLLWVLMPRQSVQFTVPAILDRDPEWPAKHADVMVALQRSRWFVTTFYAFAAVSIAVLLALQLGVEVPPFSAAREASSWRVLLPGAAKSRLFLDRTLALSYAKDWASANRPSTMRVSGAGGNFTHGWSFR